MSEHNPTGPGEDDVARWTASMLAQRCGVSRTTVYDWVNEGRLPAGVEYLADFRHRARFVVRVAELDAWVKTGRRGVSL